MKYFPVRVNTLVPDTSIQFDLYIKVADKVVHYIRESDSIDKTRLDKLKAKKVKKLFIPEESESKYLAYLDQGLAKLTQSDAPLENRAGIAHDSMVTAAENAERNLETEKGYQQVENQMSKILDFIQSDRGALKGMLGSAGKSEDIFQHSATVSSLAISLATKLGIKNSREIAELGIAGLVHDLGKTHLSFDPLKKRQDMTPDEKKEYEKHVTNALEILTKKKFITPTIVNIVANHEEVGRGRGFPEKKNLSDLPKLNQIFNLCNDFDRFCYENELAPLQGIDPFFEARGPNFNEEYISVLATVLT
jgi:putative nucleotidyltransferase with HDIG domain